MKDEGHSLFHSYVLFPPFCQVTYLVFHFFFSVKNVVGLGEGAGANIIARFAVSIQPNTF